MRNLKGKEGEGKTERYIHETSTSLLIGATFNICRFQGLETKDGMQRRVNYYLSDRFARTIYLPESMENSRFYALLDKFEAIKELKGEFSFSWDAGKLWERLQDANRARIDTVGQEISSTNDVLSSALAEEPSKTLKFAMIFHVCRWAANRTLTPLEIDTSTLQTASDHVQYGLWASQQLETIGMRAEIRGVADPIYAQINRSFLNKRKGAEIILTKSDLTSQFAPHSGRRGQMTPERLYNQIIPDLINRGLARIASKEGKAVTYAFKADSDG